MDNDIESAAAATIVIAIICKRRKVKIRKKSSAWVKPWLKRREERGIFLGLTLFRVGFLNLIYGWGGGKTAPPYLNFCLRTARDMKLCTG